MAKKPDVYLREVVVLKLVKSLEMSLGIPLPDAQDLAARAFAQLWAKNPIVKENVASLLYRQSVFLHHGDRRELMRRTKRAGKFLGRQLCDRLRQDPRESTAVKQRLHDRAESAVAQATKKPDALEKAFLEVLMTDEGAIAASSRWHVKIGRVVDALTLRGFDVTRRDVDNIRARLQRNREFRAVISWMRGEREHDHHP